MHILLLTKSVGSPIIVMNAEVVSLGCLAVEMLWYLVTCRYRVEEREMCFFYGFQLLWYRKWHNSLSSVIHPATVLWLIFHQHMWCHMMWVLCMVTKQMKPFIEQLRFQITYSTQLLSHNNRQPTVKPIQFARLYCRPTGEVKHAEFFMRRRGKSNLGDFQQEKRPSKHESLEEILPETLQIWHYSSQHTISPYNYTTKAD